MEFPGPSNAAAAPPPPPSASPSSSVITTSSSSTFPPSATPSAALTDTHVLQLSLKNAVAAVAAGKATVAANNYALVVKFFFRKCFLLEELVLLALAMGYETRKAAQEESKGGSGKKGGHQEEEAEVSGPHANQPQQLLPSLGVDAEGPTHLVDPLANVSMLLPPGLEDGDYDEERNYYEQKRQRGEGLSHNHGLGHQTPPPLSSSSQSGAAALSAAVKSTATDPNDDIPGYDAATARWLTCLLAKVHPDALPIATLEKLCKMPIPSRASRWFTTRNFTNAAAATIPSSFASPISAVRAVGETTNFSFPSWSSAAAAEPGIHVFPPDAVDVARLMPNLMPSPMSSSLDVSNNSNLNNCAASPTMAFAVARGTPTGNQSDALVAAVSSSSTSLSLLFATLLWDVACALWNEGFIEDTHHWLSVMDVRRLWKLYGDSCVRAAGCECPANGSMDISSDRRCVSPRSENGERAITPAGAAAFSHSSSMRFTSVEPKEEAVESEERACALSWLAVLTECKAADASKPQQREVAYATSDLSSTKPPTGVDKNSGLGTETKKAKEEAQQQQPAKARLSRPCSSITLSTLASASGPLPMTSIFNSSGGGAPTEGERETSFSGEMSGAATNTQATEGEDEVESGVLGNSSAARHAAATSSSLTTAASAIPLFVRRLARRTSALRDLCGLMMGCETAEDVFYIVYSFHCALQAQQHKMDQLEQQQQQQQHWQEGAKTHDKREVRALTTSGGLAEILIVSNLLVEFFLSKRAQRILLDAGVLPAHISPFNTEDAKEDKEAVKEAAQRHASTSAAQRCPFPHHTHRSEQSHRMDRAIRQACDEVVCAFTNGQCLTLYGLESYGIPAPHDCSGNAEGMEGGNGVQLLAQELPYALVSNVLSSTLNFSTLYHLSKIFRGVMGVRGGGSAPAQGPANPTNISGSNAMEDGIRGGSTCPAANVLFHPNRTRKATDEEHLRRQRWTRMLPWDQTTTATSLPLTHSTPAQQQQQQSSSQSFVGELFGFMKGAAASWHNVTNFVHPTSSDVETSNPPRPTPTAVPMHDVRPSRMDPEFFDAHLSSYVTPASARHSHGGYAERLAEARREHAEKAAAAAGRTPESTPWSAVSANATASIHSTLAEASSSSGGVTAGMRNVLSAVQTSGPGACELLLPSSVSPSVTADGMSNSGAISLLAEENERTRLSGRTPTVAAAAATTTATETVLHTPSIQLQSRTPNEAACLRLLTLLYRYPQLHTLEPITASHVDLVARELNKALHILQVAMKNRFGERWWQQWRAQREGETQRYYARALADAQRGRRALSSATTTVNASLPHNISSARTSIEGLSSVLSPSKAGTKVVPAPSAITDPAPASPTSAGVPSPVEPVLPSSMGGNNTPSTTTVHSNPSLVLCTPRGSTAMQLTQPKPSLESEYSLFDCSTVPPPAAPQPTPRQDPVLSKFWNTRTLFIPTSESMRERRQNLLERSIPAPAVTAVTATTNTTVETTVVADDGTLIDVNWDVTPAYTPDVSLDFSAFTTSAVETQEATRQLVEALQRQQHDADDANANVPGVSLLSRTCRRLLHNELPLLQQYCPWRVVYSTRIHGVSLGTLFANCRRESERHMRLPNGLFSLPSATESNTRNSFSSGCNAPSPDARPMLLVLELPPSTTVRFAEDDAGVREALTELRKPLTVEKASQAAAETALADYRASRSFNKLYIGAYLSDLLRLESRRYYGSQECFVFQLFIPAEKSREKEEDGEGTSEEAVPPPEPQLRVFHATRQNAQFINCRVNSIVIGGGGGGSSVYLDDSLCHGATSACATFHSPPLSVWQHAASTLCDVAGVRQPGAENKNSEEDEGLQHSLYVLNVEVIVMDA